MKVEIKNWRTGAVIHTFDAPDDVTPQRALGLAAQDAARQCVKLAYAKLPGADMAGINLNDSDLSHADLNGADMSGADMRYAHEPDRRRSDWRESDPHQDAIRLAA